MRMLLLAAPLALAACMNPPIAVTPTNNPNVPLQLLFEKDGCRVYRFWDAGQHYFARCWGPPGPAIAVTSSPHGKNEVRAVVVADGP